MIESYEELRDQATGAGAEAWRAADRRENQLRETYRALKDDPRFTDEHKAQKAWEAYDAAKDAIEAERAKAREHLEMQASSGVRASLPFPDGEGPVTSDTQKYLATQNEAARIVRKIDRIGASAKGVPLKASPPDVLRQEYGRGLEAGGAPGGIVCRGELAAADALGVYAESVVDGFRKDRHREALERAQTSERLAQSVGGRVPELPFSRAGRAAQPGDGPRPLFIPRARASVAKSGGRHW